MDSVISNTSPLQYLHQLAHLELLRSLCGHVIVPPAVVGELRAGIRAGFDVPDPTLLDWIKVREPAAGPALRLVVDLGAGESAVLALALEIPGAIAILDDALARASGERIGIRVVGTLGILPQAKKKSLVPAVRPLLERVETLRFRLSERTKVTILRRAGELFSFTTACATSFVTTAISGASGPLCLGLPE
ncbi:MAG: DUF3368 domain-containing protein [Candidatus Riflebacteria bacterium]|nr:DUF3368 domain-containing protein [Candidatus Riflebacteria bacterium]